MDITSLRKKWGMTQHDLAVLLGRDPGTVSRYERGGMTPGDPDLDLLSALERTLKLKRPPAIRRILRQKGRLAAIHRLAVA